MTTEFRAFLNLNRDYNTSATVTIPRHLADEKEQTDKRQQPDVAFFTVTNTPVNTRPPSRLEYRDETANRRR